MSKFLTRRNVRLDAAQKAYLSRAETLIGMQMSPIAAAFLRPVCDSLEYGNVSMFPVEYTSIETIVDVPRELSKANQRVLAVGQLNVTVDDNMPWKVALKHGGDCNRMDLAVGPMVYEQQRLYLSGSEPLTACRSGVLYRRLENNKVVFSIGMYLVQDKVIHFDVLWVDVKDAKSVLLFGKFPTSGNHGDVHCGHVQEGDLIIEFAKPLKHQVAKLGIDGQPLLQPNSPMAMPRQYAESIFDSAEARLRKAIRTPIDAASGFNVYEVAYMDEFLEGITGTGWSTRQVAMAAAGSLDSFVRQAPVMFPKDATVASVAKVSDRLEVTFETGEVWSVPAAAAVDIELRAYSEFESVGVWTTRASMPLRAESLNECDVYSMLMSLSHTYGIPGEFEGRDAMYVPVGLLGSLAVRGSDGGVLRFVGFDKSMWSKELSTFVLPAATYENSWQLGSYTFELPSSASDKDRQQLKKVAKKFSPRMQRNNA